MKYAKVLWTEVVIESFYFPVTHPLAEKCMAPACRVTRKIHVNSFQHLGSSSSFGYGLSPSCNEHAAIPQPQLREAQELSQTYPSFVLWTTLFHGLLNRIPKMLAEQASLYYGLEKSESPSRKPCMNTNRRSPKESFNSGGEYCLHICNKKLPFRRKCPLTVAKVE